MTAAVKSWPKLTPVWGSAGLNVAPASIRPLTWMDAAVAFFGYDPLAKVLYRKLSVRFEEQIG